MTPILGGAPETRTVDGVDGIRVPTIRGHLRFWWRTLHGHEHGEASGLFAAERALWGGMSGQDDVGGRSLVDVRVTNVNLAGVTTDEVRPYPRQGQPATPGAYALWPARGTNEEPTAPRRVQGTQFDLELLFPEEHTQAVRSAVLAWTLFGGYGSRTRRGVGSLRCLSDGWLPTSATVDALKVLFDSDVLHDGEFSL
ncbi:MAG: CRISPR-associated protein Cmr1, partial [Acidobacteria bacterium]|nr:CRISPR-associated protein Cmr1 [Acidobacteriota bacterium]